MDAQELRAAHVASRLATKTVVRYPVDCDLSMMSLFTAMGKIGDGPYLLFVHRERRPWAIHYVCTAFPGPFGEQLTKGFTVLSHDKNDEDEWWMENDTMKFYSPGA